MEEMSKAILPTSAEVNLKESANEELRVPATGLADSKAYLNWQFRLLHRDLVLWTRDEIQHFTKSGQTYHHTLLLENLTLEGPHSSGQHPWSLQFLCLSDFPRLRHVSEDKRRDYLRDDESFLKHESSVCLLVDNQPQWFGYLIREEDLLCLSPPVLSVRLLGTEMEQAVFTLRTAKHISLLQLNTALFAYEPILSGLTNMPELPLKESLLHWSAGTSTPRINYTLTKELMRIMKTLGSDPACELKGLLKLRSNITLDRSQAACFRAGLSQRVALIQGPPGTGKSFIGSLIAKAILEHSGETILLVCLSHHNLDQILTYALRIGISASAIVRMGSAKKAVKQTYTLSLKIARAKQKFSSSQKGELMQHKAAINDAVSKLRAAFDIVNRPITKADIMKHIEARKVEQPFYKAFNPPPARGEPKSAHGFYLLGRWFNGKKCDKPKGHGREYDSVWGLHVKQRKGLYSTWMHQVASERFDALRKAGEEHDVHVEKLNAVHRDRDISIIKRKRIIACTATAAAKYMLTVQSAKPTIVFVEEAGQILESNILTALGPATKQLIMIGDHQQLRPRAHHSLSVENCDGFGLNRSLFERLILAGYTHQRLSQQHRMRPEISALLRELSYPGLKDSPQVLGREHLRGLQDDVIFINHSERETKLNDAHEWRDAASTKSKSNHFEARMVVKCAEYLLQQGYLASNIALLTPYLGQLRLLMQEMQQHSNPLLSDLDSQDLLRAGLTLPSLPRADKPSMRVSTIDNFQGDESDIVIVSLTRSNAWNGIGFMAARERLNVLISRARCGLVLIGNAQTFQSSANKDSPWKRFIEILTSRGHMYRGLPTRCTRHDTSQALLSSPKDFEEFPNGGCREPCKSLASCGIHQCPSHCHTPCDSKKIVCQVEIDWVCKDGHRDTRKCHSQDQTCKTCRLEDIRRHAFAKDSSISVTKEVNDIMHELLALLSERYQDAAAIEGGPAGLFVRVFCRRVAQSCSGLEGSATRAVLQNAWKIVTKRKDARLSRPNKSNVSLQGERFEKEDLLGPEPRKYLTLSHPWQRMQELIGVQCVKVSMSNLFDILQLRHELELEEKPIVPLTLNRLFVGQFGMGKTTVCWLYAEMLSDLGILQSSDVVFRHSDDLIGNSVEDSVHNADAVLRKSKGRLLAIQDAAALTAQTSVVPKARRMAVVDRLLKAAGCGASSVCLILMFKTIKAARHFLREAQEARIATDLSTDAALRFESHSLEELGMLLDFMLCKRKLSATTAARVAALERLQRAMGPGFGNAGAVAALIDTAEVRASRRQSGPCAKVTQAEKYLVLEKEDFEDGNED